jgi:hypothetical protein
MIIRKNESLNRKEIIKLEKIKNYRTEEKEKTTDRIQGCYVVN